MCYFSDYFNLKKKMKILKYLLVASFVFSSARLNAQINVEKQTKKFGWVDVNKDKKITLEEMVNFHKDKVNKKGKPINGRLLFLGLDSNNDKKITLKEFTKKPNWEEAKRKNEKLKTRRKNKK